MIGETYRKMYSHIVKELLIPSGQKRLKRKINKKEHTANMTRKRDLLCINSYSAAEGRHLFLQNARSQMFDGALNMPQLFLL